SVTMGRGVRNTAAGNAVAAVAAGQGRAGRGIAGPGNEKPAPMRGSLRCCDDGCEPSMVPRRGLEPPRFYPLVPETSASTNSATWAGVAGGAGPGRQRAA